MGRLSLILTGLFFSHTSSAESCEEPLTLRSVTPAPDQHDVPVDSRILVSFIGQGEAHEFDVSLLEAAQAVETQNHSWCYEHEGPYEKHCWWSLHPMQALSPNQSHTIRIQSTEHHSGEESFEFFSSFQTGSEPHPSLDEAPPSVEILEVIDLDESETDSCDYAEPRRLLLAPTHAMEDAASLGVYQIEELRPDSTAFAVHTVFATQPVQEREFAIKQYADLSADPTGCYRLWVENGAGTPSQKTEFCWESEEPDTGDTGEADDTGDTGEPNDTGGLVDTGEKGPSNPSPDPSSSCGCTSTNPNPSPWMGLWGLVLLRRRR